MSDYNKSEKTMRVAINGQKNKSWKSDCHENLKEIIQDALGNGHVICRIMENLDA